MDKSKYEQDIEALVAEGTLLYYSMYFAAHPEQRKEHKDVLDKFEKDGKLPGFHDSYQTWYSEALDCLKQLLPSRVDDFISYYLPAKNRKDIKYDNYTVRDYLDGLRVTRGWEQEVVVDSKAAIPKFQQQLEIVKALKKRFKSSLFDIQTLAQADIFDNELDAASELNKKGFNRAAGAVAGVVLEGHLNTVCDRHKVKVAKKNPTISDFNDALKNAGVIEVAVWRKIQFLGDIRNKCDHKKTVDPTQDEIEELIDGVRKYVKTLF